MDKNNKKSRYQNFMAAKNTTKFYIPRCLYKIQLIMNKLNI